MTHHHSSPCSRAWPGAVLCIAGLLLFSATAAGQRVLTSGPMTPAGGSGSSQVFSFTASHSQGYENITWIAALFTPDINGSLPGCNVWFRWATATLVLIDDSGGWPSRTLPQGGYLSNGRCQLDVGASSFTTQGQTLTLTIALGFKPVFAGLRQAHLHVSDAAGDNGWPSVGTYTVATQPSILSITPNATAVPAPAATFAIRYWNPNGAAAMDWAKAGFSYAVDMVRACFLYYAPASNQLQLTTDDGSGYLPPGQPGTSGTIQNGQCAIDLANSSALSEGGELLLTLKVAFAPQYRGRSNLYAWHHDTVSNQASPAVPLGSWTAYAALPDPPVGSLSPTSGSGNAGTFTATATSVNGNHYLTWISPLITPGIGSGLPGCSVWHRVGSNRIILVDDAGNWQGWPLGQAGMLSNSRCQVNPGTSSATASGDTAAVNAAVSFQPGFAGVKDVHVYAEDRYQGTPWPKMGTWTVTGGGQQYYLATAVNPAGAGTISPPSGFYESGTVVTVSAAAGSNYQFAGFSGALSGATNPQSLTMTGNSTVTATFQPVATPDFTVAAAVPVTVPAGQSGGTTVTVVPLGGFHSAVTFSAPGWPSGLSAAFNPASVNGSPSWSSAVTVTAAASVAPGVYNLSFSGTSASPALVRTGSIPVTVTAAPTFTLDLPTSVTVEAGFQSSFRLKITPQNGFNSPVSWSLTPGAPGVSATSAANSQPGLTATVATGMLYATAAASPGTYAVTVRADGGGVSRSADIPLIVIRPYRAESETNMAFIDFPRYNDSHQVGSGLPFLAATCGSTTGMRTCYRQILNTYRIQQISGVRFMFSMADAITYSTGVIRQDWLAGVRAFFEDLREYQITRITPTPSWDWPSFDGTFVYREPVALPGCPDTNFYSGVTQLRFNRTAPFGEACSGDCTQNENWKPDGSSKISAYTCAMANPNFIGWNALYDVIDAMLRAARDSALTIQEFDANNEIQLSAIPVRGRLIVDNTNNNTDVLGTVGSGSRSLRQSMYDHGFDPGRVTYSVIGSVAHKALGECPAYPQENYAYFGDSGRISELSLLMAVMGTGGPVGITWIYHVFHPPTPEDDPGSGLPCGAATAGAGQLAFTHLPPTILDVHNSPCVNVPNHVKGSGKCDPGKWSDVAGEARAMGTALAAFQQSFSPGGWRGAVPNVANALVMLGETHGANKPGDPVAQAATCRESNRGSEFTACSMQFSEDTNDPQFNPLLTRACWKVSALQDTYTGFMTSALSTRIRPNGLPATLAFRPWEYLQQWDSSQAAACNSLSTNPPYTPAP